MRIDLYFSSLGYLLGGDIIRGSKAVLEAFQIIVYKQMSYVLKNEKYTHK